MKKFDNKGFAHAGLVLLALVVLVAIGGVGWYVFSKKATKNDSVTNTSTVPKTTSTVVPKTTSESTNQQNSTTKTTTVSAHDKKLSVSVTHPSNWKVKKTEPRYPGWSSLYIVSKKGHYLHLWEPDGLGGDCQSNNYTYTLVKKLPTATKGIYFTEYTVSNPQWGNVQLSLEVFDSSSWGSQVTAEKKHNNLKEGETNTDTCTNTVGSYSWVVKETANGLDTMYVTINKKPEKTLGSTVPYNELAKDKEFIQMLQSLKVKTK